MITGDMLKEAINTQTDTCKARGCIHADAIAEVEGDVLKAIYDAKSHALALGDISGERSVFGWGLHIGYRLRQLEEQDDFSKVMKEATKDAA